MLTADGEQRYRAAFAWLSCTTRGKNADDILNMVPLATGSLSIATTIEANENEMLCEHAPETLRRAMINALKKQQQPTVGTRSTISIQLHGQIACRVACRPNSTVGQLKQAIATHMNVGMAGMVLTFKPHLSGTVLQDDRRTLSSYNVVADDQSELTMHP